MPTLFTVMFSSQVPPSVLSFFLVDIASTFNIPVGVAGQLSTAGFIITIITAVFVGVLTSKLTYKTLLLISTGCLGIIGVGSALSPSFETFLLMYSLVGITTGLTFSLILALIGRYFPVHERPKRSSYISVGYVLPGIVTPPIFNVIGDWRIAFLVIVGIACLTCLLILVGLPSEEHATGRPLQGYKEVLKNRSALGVIFANIFATAGFIVLAVFTLSLFREKFNAASDMVSMIAVGMSIAYMLGILVGGRVIHKFGRKTLTVLFCFVIGLAIIGLTVMPSFWIVVICYYVGTFSGGIRGLAFINLALEQVPEHQAVMQSMTTVSQYGASTLGTTLGGLILIWLDYDWLAILGVLTIVGGFIFQFATTDPAS